MRMKVKKTNMKKSIQQLFKPLINISRSQDKDYLTRNLPEAAGLEHEYMNPDAMLDKKGKDLTFYDIMLLDDVIKSTIDLKKKMALNVSHSVRPASKEQKDIDIAEAVQKNFDNMDISFNDQLDNLLDAMAYGFKVGEIIWNTELVNGLWTWKYVKFMHSIFFDFHYDEFNNMDKVAIGRNYGSSTEVPRDEFEQKFIYMVYPYLKDGNWYGDSDLKELYVEWWQKFNIIRWRGIYLQNFGMPVPIVTYDSSKISATEKSDIDDMLDSWQDLMQVKIPGTRDPVSGELRPKFDIQWRDIGTDKGAMQFNETIEMINKEIRRKLLVPDKLGFSADTTGSFSQSKVFFDMFLLIIRDLHTRLEAIINDKVKQFVDFNFQVQEYPVWEFDEIDETIEIEMLRLLIEKGVIDKREKWIRAHVGIPDITDKEMEEIEKAREEDRKNQPPAFPGFPQRQFNKKQFKNQPIDFKKIEEQYDTHENDFLKDYNAIMEKEEEKLLNTIERKKIIENKDYKAMKKLRISKTELKRLISEFYAQMYLEGKTDAIEEIQDNPVSENIEFKSYVPVKFQQEEWLDRAWIDRFLKKYGELGILTSADKEYLTTLRDRAFFITGETENRVLRTAYHTLDEGIRTGAIPKQTIAKLREVLSEDREKYALTIARTNSSDAYNTGRMNEFTSDAVIPYMEAFQYSAIIDIATTPFCREHDGQIISVNDPNLATVNPPNHFNCRSLFISIMVGQDEVEGDFYEGYKDKPSQFPQWGTNVTAVRPAEGFGG